MTLSTKLRANAQLTTRNSERYRADDFGGECAEFGGGVFPGEFGDAEFFGAEAGEKLLACPAGFAADLGEEEAVSRAAGEMDAVLFGIEVERTGGFLEWAEDGDFDG